MSTILVIAQDVTVQDRWCRAIHERGFEACRRPDVLTSIAALGRQPVDAIVAHTSGTDELSLLRSFSAHRPLPPMLVVTDDRPRVALRLQSALVVAATAPPDHLVAALVRLLEVAPRGAVTLLPVLPTPAVKWTQRLAVGTGSYPIRAPGDGG